MSTESNPTPAAGTEPSALIRVENLSKTFVGQKALDQVSLEIAPGEVHALLGQNGCGKSTLIKVLTGYHPPDRGARFYVGGEEAHLHHGGLVAAGGERIEIRAVHQDLGLADRLNAVDNIGLVIGYSSAAAGNIGWRDQAARTRELLNRVGASDLDIWRPLDQCDKLHRTQVAIARVLATWESERGLVVLDEPTASLQAQQVDRLFEVIGEIRARGISVLYVSHRLAEIFRIADRLTVLREGRLIGTRKVSEVDHDGLISMMLGSPTALAGDARPARAGNGKSPTERPVRLSVQGLRSAELDDLSFSVHEGEILGFAGVVGSGQEELPYLLVGSHNARQGTLRIGADEHDLTKMSPRKAKRLGLGLVPADRAREALIKELSVAENITLPTVSDFEQGQWLRQKREAGFAVDWGERLELSPNQPYKQVGLFSGGNQQKVVLGKAMSVGETALILAEPTAGVDIGAKALIYNYLRKEAAAGTVMIVCSSDVTDLIEVCTRVIALRNGRIVAELTNENINEDAMLRSILAPPKGESVMETSATQQPPAKGEDPRGGDGAKVDLRRQSFFSAIRFQNISAVYLLGLVIVVFGIWIPDNFLQTDTIAQVLNENAIPGILALALVVPLAAGVFDLSVGYTLGAVSVFVAWLLGNTGLSPELCIALSVLMALAIGVVNGFIVVVMKVDSFIGTLASGSLLIALTLIISGNTALTEGIGEDFTAVAQTKIWDFTLPVFYTLAIAAIIWYFLEHRAVGRMTNASGLAPEAARLAGVRVDLIRFGSLVVSALLAGIAGILLTGTVGGGSPSVGPQYLIPAFAAAFLGATQLKGGLFNAWGTILAVVLLGTVYNGLTLAGVPIWTPFVVQGVVLIAALALAGVKRRSSGDDSSAPEELAEADSH